MTFHSLRIPLPFTSPLRPPPSPPRLPRPSTSAMHSSPSSTPQQSKPDNKSKLNQNQAITCHNQTKHSLTSGFARGPRNLDWANQPNPFLRFLSSPLLPLLHFPPHSDSSNSSPLYSSLFSSSPPAPSHPLSHSSLSRLLFDSLSLSAWKTTGSSTWPLRVNPSSGNLHPTEAHVLSPDHFLAHYSPKDHSLELRARLPSIPTGGSSLLLALSSLLARGLEVRRARLPLLQPRRRPHDRRRVHRRRRARMGRPPPRRPGPRRSPSLSRSGFCQFEFPDRIPAPGLPPPRLPL